MKFLPFLVSILFGFLIGIERERQRLPEGALGVRTFTLIAILGSVAGWRQETWLSVLSGSFVFGLVLLSYFRETRGRKTADWGVTTEIAAGIIFVLSYISHVNLVLASILSCVAALLLFWKTPIHRFTNNISHSEMEAAVLLFLFGISVLTLLKDQPIDPWGLFNPYKFGLIILVVAAIEFGSYLAVKIFGTAHSSIVIGFCAGLVSSTALVLTTSRLSRTKHESWRYHTAMVVVGKVASLLQLILVVILASSSLLLTVTVLVGGSVVVGGASIYWLMHAQQKKDLPIEVRSPIDVRGVLRLSFLLIGIFMIVAFAQQNIGAMGRDIAVLVAGFVDLHGGSLATATLFEQGQISAATVQSTLSLTIIASFTAKIIIMAFVGRGKFRIAAISTYALMMITVVLPLIFNFKSL